ncbi:hypothetical protein ZHAS_00005484 [Anopheles sinensis]|uniref:Uncharacterized protein n=1 Tax=Anopheles sinensis TaxID=74873 RepID=A0A084VJM9_ANOSI|nr:hypothetical protein ZHAS_00005484 [Anopheles sinensis]
MHRLQTTLASLFDVPEVGEDERSALIDFVGQLKASHLGKCGAIEFVHMEGVFWPARVLLQNFSQTPVYTGNELQNRGDSNIFCAIISTSLSDKRNFSKHLFSSNARLVYLLDVEDSVLLEESLALNILNSSVKKALYNSIAVTFNSSTFKAYYFDPFRQRITSLIVPSVTIYPTSKELDDLQGYALFSVFIPGESDSFVIRTMMEKLVDDRNGSLSKPMPFQVPTLLNFSSQIQWQFSFITVGPFEYATCFFVPRAGLVPIGYILVAPFDTGTWIGVLLATFLVVLLLKRFGQASRGSFASAAITLLQTLVPLAASC